MRLAYMMSRFPKLTETFVLREMVEMERLGRDVRAYPLQRERTSIVHPEAIAFVERACFTPWLSTAILFSNAKVLLRNPGRYLSTFLTLIRVNFGWTRYLSGAILFFPKVVYLSERMRKDGVQHLHAHFASHPAMAAWVIHRLSGIPYSFTAHGSDLHCDRHMLREKVADATAAVTISDYNRQLIIAECGADSASKVHVVRCGIDPKIFPARKTPTSFDRGLGPFQMVCVGTLHEVKGQQYLLQACRRVADNGLSFVCHLVGDGPDREMLEKLAAELGIAAHCKFHGKCTGPEVQQLLADIDVIVAPSVPTSDGRREGIPVVLMEGLGSGIAAIGSDLSGIPELVRHEQTGLLTPPRDATAIADALLRIATDHQLRYQLASAGCELVQKEFNVSRNTAALLSLIQGSPYADASLPAEDSAKKQEEQDHVNERNVESACLA